MLKTSLLALAYGQLQLAALTFGAALGSVQGHTAQCVKQQIEDLNHLVLQPHASYSAFQVASYSWSKWALFLCTAPGIAESFLPLEQVICHYFLPCLVPHPPNDVERTLFANPVYLGGLGIFNPSETAPATYQFCRQMTGSIVQCILQQSLFLSQYVVDQQQATVHNNKNTGIY